MRSTVAELGGTITATGNLPPHIHETLMEDMVIEGTTTALDTDQDSIKQSLLKEQEMHDKMTAEENAIKRHLLQQDVELSLCRRIKNRKSGTNAIASLVTSTVVSPIPSNSASENAASEEEETRGILPQ